MKRLFFLTVVALMSMVSVAGKNDLLWDYAIAAPKENPDRGLYFAGRVEDAQGVKNGLKGIKLNSSGWCAFQKASVAGVLKLTFGPRSGMNPSSLQVFTWSGEQPQPETFVASTCPVTGLRRQVIPLTAEQNNIYIMRLLEEETVLQRIEFVEGATDKPEPCNEPEEVVEENWDNLSENALFFLHALEEANRTGNTTIYLPNGIYDLGEKTLTAITANHISIIGESMEDVIIRNAPDYRRESISKTATLRIAQGVEGTYLQNLTLQNALDYYRNDNGRAVALWDQGTKTICKHVRLLSYQDTYYSDMPGAMKYFEDCEIHGTVDFICGDGTVYFQNTLLFCERRRKDGSGADKVTASGATPEDRGYVFEGCTIRSECPLVSLGRSWKYTPKCVFLNTTLDYSAGDFSLTGKGIERWTLKGMRTLPECFGEYRTRDTKGKIVSPKKNEITFVYKGETKTMNTILSRHEAARYSKKTILGPWAKEIQQIILTNQNYKR
jgi:hypothetical protein